MNKQTKTVPVYMLSWKAKNGDNWMQSEIGQTKLDWLIQDVKSNGGTVTKTETIDNI